MLWEDILKNAKVTGSSKGTTLSSNRIKIKKPEMCKEKLMRYSANANRLRKSRVFDPETLTTDQYESGEGEWQSLPEEVACKVIKKIDDYFVLYPEVIEGFFRDINFLELRRNMGIERVNIDGYVFERELYAYGGEFGRPRIIEIIYRLSKKYPMAPNYITNMTWYINSICYEEAGNLSDSELDWRK